MATHSKRFPTFMLDGSTQEEFDSNVDVLRDLIDRRDDLEQDDYSGRNALNIRIMARGESLMRMLMSRYMYRQNSSAFGDRNACRIPDSSAFKNLMSDACVDYDGFISKYLEMYN